MVRATLLIIGLGMATTAAEACSAGHFNQAHELARSALGTGVAPRMAYIPQSVLEADDPDHAIGTLCERVAGALEAARSEADDFAIASVDDEAEMRLLECIDHTLGGLKLPKLRVVFVGSPNRESAARAIVESWGATFHFAPDQGRAIDGLASCGGPRDSRAAS